LLRNISRRLERLERRFLPAINPFSIKIVYVDSDGVVESTFLMEPGKRGWTNLDGEQDNTGRVPTPHPTRSRSATIEKL
jgi:hypothetical protein